MAHGPCGEEFKAAFSCFVYSNDEPKGMDCVDKFQYVTSGSGLGMSESANDDMIRHMQDCFRKYPEVYGEEIREEEAAEAEAAAVASNSPAPLSDSKDVSKNATTSAAAAPVQSTEKKPASGSKPNPKPDQQAPKATHEFSTEEHKAGPTDAPKGSDSTAPAAAEKKPAKKDEPVDVRGIPVRSFDATSANASAST